MHLNRLLYLALPLAALPMLHSQSPSARRIEPIRVARKLALVVGNSGYPQKPLKNPSNDAADIAGTLGNLGFTVTRHLDLTLRQFEREVDRFAGTLQAGDLAFFYYSGHGLQIERENYLLPVDFVAKTDADVKYDAYSASLLRDKLEASGARVRVIVLDACRDNPFRSKRSGAGA